jgi:hypothetical protein
MVADFPLQSWAPGNHTSTVMYREGSIVTIDQRTGAQEGDPVMSVMGPENEGRSTTPSSARTDVLHAARLLAGQTRLLTAPDLAPYTCRLLTTAATVAAAKTLQAQAYVQHHYLSADRLTPEGWLPWHASPPAARVRWFGTFRIDDTMVAVGRKIVIDDTGIGSLPAIGLMGGDRPTALASALRRWSPHEVVEPSAIAKSSTTPLMATFLIYRAFYQDSMSRGERLWVMTVMPALRTTLRIVTAGAITVGAHPVSVLNDYPGMAADAPAYPAWTEVSALPHRMRAAADATENGEYSRFLHAGATFLDEGAGG